MGKIEPARLLDTRFLDLDDRETGTALPPTNSFEFYSLPETFFRYTM